MNLEKRFIETSNFLKKHQEIVNFEVLSFENKIPSPYSNWLNEINDLTTDQKVALENNESFDGITNTEYISYLNELRNLTSIPKIELKNSRLNDNLGKKISLKKKHEISHINQYLKQKIFSRVVDIGSGAGHLSSILIANGVKESLCIDSSDEYQRIGVKKLERYAPEILEKMTFKHLVYDKPSDIELHSDDLIIGLHSCGDLSVKLLETVIEKNKGSLLNYGCCYHKLSRKKLNLSHLAKTQGLDLSVTALTMAAKGYKSQTIEGYRQKVRVKNFRYSLHLIDSILMGEEFKTLGNALKSDYTGSFIEYVKKFSPSILEKNNEEKVMELYTSFDMQSKITSLLSLGIIRCQLARVIELYLVLDRALYLKENGFDVELRETFDKNLSPRNISLYAQRRSDGSSTSII